MVDSLWMTHLLYFTQRGTLDIDYLIIIHSLPFQSPKRRAAAGRQNGPRIWYEKPIRRSLSRCNHRRNSRQLWGQHRSHVVRW